MLFFSWTLTVLQIDLKTDDYVYDMMKGNPKLDFETILDVVTFRYRDKYKIKWVAVTSCISSHVFLIHPELNW